MGTSKPSRRIFIKETLGTGLLVAGSGLLPANTLFRMSKSEFAHDAKGLPTTILGKTGAKIPIMALGCGSRFCNIETAEEAHRVLNFALDNGLYYWDTASAYENKKLGITSEERLGEVVGKRRKEIFLSTKVGSRDPNEAMRQLENSLKKLKTDHLDMLKIHNVLSEEDVAKLSEKGNLIDIVLKMKEQGVTRFIGFTGHSNVKALQMMADKGIFDSMLMAMNHYNQDTDPQKRQEEVIPTAKSHGMGLMLIKAVRPRETVKGLDAKDLVKYALSLKGPDGVVVGMDSIEVVKLNLEILRSFKPFDEVRMKELAMQLTPFYNHENLPWMKPGYTDGNWA